MVQLWCSGQANTLVLEPVVLTLMIVRGDSNGPYGGSLNIWFSRNYLDDITFGEAMALPLGF